MNFRNVFALCCLLLIGLAATYTTNAQGVIVPIRCDVRPCIPRPQPQPIPNALPVKSINLDTTIEGQVATTRVTQVFRNDTSYTLEGTYFFPIPETASIVEFAIWENGKKLVGEVRSREEARKIYDEIVRRQRDPGLLEYAGKDLFQASIFPIPPNSDKKLELTYSQILKAESGTVAYRYPLGTGRNLWSPPVSPIDDAGTRRADSKKPSGNQKFGTISGKIEISGNEALRNVYSPSHSIEVNQKGETKAVVTFETTSSDNDFQLFYGLSNSDFGMSLLTYREPGKDGYFLLMVSPKDDVAEREIVNKDIVFVLDTSGSMKAEGKMEKARAALIFGIQGLRDGDRFNVINFAGEEHLLENKLMTANVANKKLGETFVNKLEPNGGTNINDALRAALRQFDSSERPKMLVFLTDGLPTVSETSVEKIIKNAKDVRVDNLRLFPFGVGYDVNTQLLDRLAAENKGVSEYVEPKEDLEVKVSNFFTKVNSPVLSDLAIDFGGVKTDLNYPRELTDIFKGSQLVIIGRYENAADVEDVTLRLTGKSGSSEKAFSYRNLDFPMRATKNDFLPRLWASRRVGWLMEQIRSNGENKELRDEVVELGTRYGIVTPYTSYLATDGSENQFMSDGRPFTVDGASGGGTRTLSEEKRRADSTPRPSAKPSGADAVRKSKQQNAMQANASVATPDDKDKEENSIIVQNTATNQFVGNKNFINRDNNWIDVEFDETAKLPEVKLKFASDAYFDALAKEPELAQYFALGKNVTVIWKNKVYLITE